MTMATASTYNEQGKTIWSHAPGVTLVTLAVKLPPRSPTSQLKVGMVTACPPRPRGAEQAGLLKRPICTAWERQLPPIFKNIHFQFPFAFPFSVSSFSTIFQHSPFPFQLEKGGQQLRKRQKSLVTKVTRGKMGKMRGHQEVTRNW